MEEEEKLLNETLRGWKDEVDTDEYQEEVQLTSFSTAPVENAKRRAKVQPFSSLQKVTVERSEADRPLQHALDEENQEEEGLVSGEEGVDERETYRIKGEGVLAKRTKLQFTVFDQGHDQAMRSVLFVNLGIIVGCVILGASLQMMSFLFVAFLLLFLFPPIFYLTGSRKLVIDKKRKAVQQTTIKYFLLKRIVTHDLHTVICSSVQFKPNRLNERVNKVVLELTSGENLDVTMYYDPLNDDVKHTISQRINEFLREANDALWEDVGSDVDQEEPGVDIEQG
eukprot:CAMPEP_0174264254 /NCGR_PEP_ID=MMETSP0439-20130205/21869_1 /TAXON_ID=0 /ORGANISM="Stereomyxa ramosa, Strain Chinc5" /LENGTH=281 /DNA_ID=CAMNT_0015350047 /DNA_START=1 /DNA_END=846 /DNA_ORIENTATION=+